MSKQKYNHKEIETKWSKKWSESQIYKTPEISKDDKNKYYILDMFPYPSGAGLHVGHVEGYTATDIVARFNRMNGKKVLHPIGWDAFGLPAENYAIKTGFHPRINTDEAIKTFTQQINSVGLSYDFEREIGTHNPDYYKWTQWFFLFLYKRGLAYKKEAPVNWCDGCKTVLANEQVVDGVCERCDTVVIQKNMSQWFFKITDYAERLLNDLDKLNWPESTKAGQRNWIGKSEGAEVKFQILNTKKQITVFTTRLDTIYGATFLVLSPENPIVTQLVSTDKKVKVEEYQAAAKKRTELERTSDKDKSGVFTGAYAINPFTKKQIPVWVSDFVISTYGTGALMAVPAHDERDFEFAKKFGLEVVQVIESNSAELPYREKGILINSDNYNSLTSEEAYKQMVAKIELEGIGNKKINYKLRDWLVSRQRYWGAPIPIIYKKKNDSLISTRKVLVGTRNQAKFDMMKFCLKDIPGIELLSLNDIGEIDDSDLVEGKDFRENSRMKSEYYFKKTGIPTISTDNIIWVEKWNKDDGFIVHIRKEANPNSDRASDTEVIEFITNFVNTNGESKSNFHYAVSYTDESGTQNFVSIQKDYNLVATPSKIRSEGYPLKSMLKDPTTSEYKSEQSDKISFSNLEKLLKGEFAEKVFNFKKLNFIILHGFGTNVNKLWYSWYKTELEKQGHNAHLIELPNPDYPNYEAWTNEVEQNYKEILEDSENLILAGHSMGGYLALKLAEKYKAKKVITIAPGIAPDNSDEYKKYNDQLSPEVVNAVIDFYEKGGNLDSEKIKDNVNEVVIFYSDDDNAVLKDRQEKVKSQLPFAKVVQFTDRGHFNKTTTEIPELLLHSNLNSSDKFEPIAIDESELPVILPDDVEFKPTGVSPLTDHKEFHKLNESKYGKGAYRESDTIDTFVDSSWYFFRFTDPKNPNEFASKEAMQKWAPVDIYVGGAEHTVLHLLYARFFTKALFDAGYINFDEPFIQLRHPGMILGEDNRKMSKRWGNVINPLDVVDELGADALRIYEMFMGQFDQMKPWSTQTIQGVRRFLDRVYNLKDLVIEKSDNSKIESELNKLIKKVGSDIEDFKFNTSVAEFMKFTNLIEVEKQISKDQWKRFLIILAPYAPFITEELWQEINKTEFTKESSIHSQSWPKYDESLIQQSTIKIGVQVNGKLRADVEVELEESEDSVRERVLNMDEIKKFVEGQAIRKFIYIKGKIVNIVI